MPYAVAGPVQGLEELKDALAGVDRRVRKQALKKGVNAGGKVVLDRAKQLVRVRTKLLKKSLGRRVKVYEGTVVAIIGPRAGFRTEAGVRRRGPDAGKPYFENPTQIAHLVEKGTRRSRAFPFMRPALDGSRQQVSDAVGRAVQAELHK